MKTSHGVLKMVRGIDIVWIEANQITSGRTLSPLARVMHCSCWYRSVQVKLNIPEFKQPRCLRVTPSCTISVD